MEDYITSGKICKEAREYGVSLLKEDAKFSDIVERIEAKIEELGGKPAFPVDIGVDFLAAHDSPRFNDDRVLKKGDVVKLDLGVHVDGAVTDCAVTVEVGDNKFSKMIDCAEEALKKAIETAKPGVELREIGRVIQDTIKGFGYSPIINLSGHRVDLYEVHAKPTIPNYDNGDKTKLEEGQIFAIEPFVTNGEGRVIEGKPCGIYALQNVKNTRDRVAREILKFIAEEYKTLPFAERWIIKKFGVKAKIGLLFLKREDIIKEYTILPEKSKGQVTQAERTIIVGKGVIN